MQQPRLKTLGLILASLTSVAASMSSGCNVPAPTGAPEPTPTTSFKVVESRPPSRDETGPITDTVKLSRSSSALQPKPQSLHFSGEYDQGKVCLPYGDDGRSSAMYLLNRFRVIGSIRGSDTLKKRVANPPLTFECIGGLKGDRLGLVKGKTYTVRLVPSDETWKQIEQGRNVVMLDGEEVEILLDETPK